QPDNLVVFVVDNGVYESIGWSSQGRRSTATAGRVDLAAIAAGCGVPYTVDVTAEDELDSEIDLAFSRNVCSFINVRTRPGHSHVRPRRTELRALRGAPRGHLDNRRPAPGHRPHEGQGALAPTATRGLTPVLTWQWSAALASVRRWRASCRGGDNAWSHWP
ncbi:MAG: hypothetical protein J4F50_05185, partial [Acidimicrobiia bacterium]|nr:hypothetical protein [Acidimicrobiia bacterium]